MFLTIRRQREWLGLGASLEEQRPLLSQNLQFLLRSSLVSVVIPFFLSEAWLEVVDDFDFDFVALLYNETQSNVNRDSISVEWGGS